MVSKSKPPAKFDHAIICDEIRQEINKKYILVGVYTGDILIKNFPVNMGLSALLHGRTEAGAEIAVELRYIQVEF